MDEGLRRLQFRSHAWQDDGETQADDEIAEGRTTTFADPQAALSWLRTPYIEADDDGHKCRKIRLRPATGEDPYP